MKTWVAFSLFSLMVFSSVHATELTELIHQEESRVIQVNQLQNLVPSHEQLSCKGMDSQMQDSVDRIEDLAVYTKAMSRQVSFKALLQFQKYLSHRAALELDFLSYQEMFLARIQIPFLLQNQTQQVGVLTSTGFWAFPMVGYDSERLQAKTAKNSLELALYLNSFDVCSAQEVQIFEFANCESQDDVFVNCNESGQCSDLMAGPWNRCKQVVKTRVDLLSVRELLGKRGGSLQRRAYNE